MMKTIAVLTSGGDSPGMNAAIRAVVRSGIHQGYRVYGVEQGYEGVLADEFKLMNSNSVAGIIQLGGTVLKTARSETFKTDAGFAAAVKILKARSIDCLVVIGGDGSMRGAQRLAEAGIATMVIPGTIDNDMPGTEYTLGFDTALNNVLDAVNKIRDTAASHQRVAVVEVMGRHAGHIALTAGVACGAEAILIPEVKTDLAELCDSLRKRFKRGKVYAIVIVAEGAGRAYDVAATIGNITGINTPVTVLGYIQRGGNPSVYDNVMASRMGAMAVECLTRGEVNRLIAFQAGKVVSVPYAEATVKRGLDPELCKLAGILAT